jgi:hypothetical protein
MASPASSKAQSEPATDAESALLFRVHITYDKNTPGHITTGSTTQPLNFSPRWCAIESRSAPGFHPAMESEHAICIYAKLR